LWYYVLVDGLLRENSAKLWMEIICNTTFGKVQREREIEGGELYASKGV
jgi:hypothetical protein